MADAAAPAPRGPDILVRTAPPLSATSDAPLADVPKPPASASNDATDQASGTPAEMSPEAQAAARVARVDPGPDADASADATPADKVAADKAAADKAAADEIETIQVDGRDVPLPPWMKREITKARNRQRDAEASAKTAAEELTALKASLEELKAKVETPKPTEAVVETPDPRPTRDKFEDPDSYDVALTEWATREGERKAVEKVGAERAAAEAEAAAKAADARKASQDAEIARMNAEWTTKVAKATEKYTDYNDVAQNDAVQITMPMAHAIMLADNGPDVAYHLGKNLEEATRIASLTNPVAQAMQIGMLAARLATPQPRAARARPLEPITTGVAPADTSGREPSMDEHAATVNGRIAAQRRPFFSASPGAAVRH